MSSVVLLWRRDGAPAETRAASSMDACLVHRGPDGQTTRTDGSLVIACRHFRTTPEEIDECQPVGDERRLLAFDGRLDNRDELLDALDRDDPASRKVSDADLILEAFDRWGEGCFERLIGPFAVAVWDGRKKNVVLARDPLGDRTLFFRLDRQRLLVASEEQALLAHPEVSRRLNEDRIACHFAIQVPDDGSTFFAEISELRPGHMLSVGMAGHRERRFTRLKPEPGIDRLSDADCAEQFLELLTTAVRSRMRSTTPPAVMMSGGIDSTSIAAIAAREPDGADPAQRVRAVSWVFDELDQCDEREFIHLVLADAGIEGLESRGDDAWPLRDLEHLAPNPGSPECNPYRELKRGVYRLAARSGSRVVFNGASADLMYSGAGVWFADLLREGRITEAARSLAVDVRKRGLIGALRKAGAGAIVRPFRTSCANPGKTMPWLTANARMRLASAMPRPVVDDVCRRPQQVESMAGARAARGVSFEIFDAACAGIDLRHPYRDRRLVEFMLAVPAHQLYRRGRFKHLARVAAKNLLPEEIPARDQPTLLTPLFNRGVRDRGTETVQAILKESNAHWPCYVDRGWLSDVLQNGPRRPIDDVIVWHCLGFEHWMRRHQHGITMGSVVTREKTA